MGTDLSKLHPVFADRLSRLMAASGTWLQSGWRSSEEQEYLWNCYQTGSCNNGNPANRPGESNHEAIPYGEAKGLAADLGGNLAAAHALCGDYGIHFPILSVEPWHCQPTEVKLAYYTGMPVIEGVPGVEETIDVSAKRKNPSELKLSSQGADLIADFEGFSPVVYLDSVGVETIGYGETRQDIINKYRDIRITQQEAYQLLLQRAEDDYASGVRQYIKVPLAQSEFDALTSFAYNLGRDVFQGATLTSLLNSGDYVGASKEFIKWNKADGKVLAGLTDRRKKEEALFKSEWGLKVSTEAVLLLNQEDEMPRDFRRREGGFNGKPCYDDEWVPQNGLDLIEGVEWRVNIHVQQLIPVAGKSARFTIYGQGFGKFEGEVSGGSTAEFQPSGYGAVAIVSEDGVELKCSWDRVMERQT